MLRAPSCSGCGTKEIQPFPTTLFPSSHNSPSPWPSGNENALSGYFKYIIASGLFADWKVYSKKVQRCLCDKWEDIGWDAWQGRKNTVVCMQDGSERRGVRHELLK